MGDQGVAGDAEQLAKAPGVRAGKEQVAVPVGAAVLVQGLSPVSQFRDPRILRPR